MKIIKNSWDSSKKINKKEDVNPSKTTGIHQRRLIKKKMEIHQKQLGFIKED